MKRIFALLLAAVMCFSLVACDGDEETSSNNEPQTNETTNSETETSESDSQKETIESTDNVSSDNATEEAIVVTLDAECLTGVWVRHEKDKELEKSLLNFELNADETGTVNLSENGEVNSFPIIKWYINEMQSVVELYIDTDADNIENTIYYLCVCPECGALTDAFAGEPCFVKETE